MFITSTIQATAHSAWNSFNVASCSFTVTRNSVSAALLQCLHLHAWGNWHSMSPACWLWPVTGCMPVRQADGCAVPRPSVVCVPHSGVSCLSLGSLRNRPGSPHTQMPCCAWFHLIIPHKKDCFSPWRACYHAWHSVTSAAEPTVSSCTAALGQPMPAAAAVVRLSRVPLTTVPLCHSIRACLCGRSHTCCLRQAGHECRPFGTHRTAFAQHHTWLADQ